MTNTTYINYLRPAIAVGLLAGIAACGGGGGETTASSGSLRLALTDAPSCGFDKVNVTIQKVRVHQSAAAAETDTGWSEVVLSPPVKVDLLSLTNGVLAELGQTPLPAGKYTQLRLVLAENGSSAPFANSVLPTGGTTELALRTPSGQQSGLKTNVNIDVAANQLADVVLDFDACKSIVTAGNSGNYNLKPVLTVIPRLLSGVQGYVAPSLANGNTTVALQQNGVTLRSTTPDSTGRFLLQPVLPGSYSVVLTAPARVTTIVNSVPVTSATVSDLNPASAPLNSPSAPVGVLNGTVQANISPIEAIVRALQTLTGGARIEVVSRPADSVTGSYSYSVPTTAPQVATYAVAPALLNFSADAAAAGRYTLEAQSSGAVKSTGTVTATTAAPVSSNFAFP